MINMESFDIHTGWISRCALVLIESFIRVGSRLTLIFSVSFFKAITVKKNLTHGLECVMEICPSAWPSSDSSQDRAMDYVITIETVELVLLVF